MEEEPNEEMVTADKQLKEEYETYDKENNLEYEEPQERDTQEEITEKQTNKPTVNEQEGDTLDKALATQGKEYEDEQDEEKEDYNKCYYYFDDQEDKRFSEKLTPKDPKLASISVAGTMIPSESIDVLLNKPIHELVQLPIKRDLEEEDIVEISDITIPVNANKLNLEVGNIQDVVMNYKETSIQHGEEINDPIEPKKNSSLLIPTEVDLRLAHLDVGHRKCPNRTKGPHVTNSIKEPTMNKKKIMHEELHSYSNSRARSALGWDPDMQQFLNLNHLLTNENAKIRKRGKKSKVLINQNSKITTVAEKFNVLRYRSHFPYVHKGAHFAPIETTKLLPEMLKELLKIEKSNMNTLIKIEMIKIEMTHPLPKSKRANPYAFPNASTTSNLNSRAPNGIGIAINAAVLGLSILDLGIYALKQNRRVWAALKYLIFSVQGRILSKLERYDCCPYNMWRAGGIYKFPEIENNAARLCELYGIASSAPSATTIRTMERLATACFIVRMIQTIRKRKQFGEAVRRFKHGDDSMRRNAVASIRTGKIFSPRVMGKEKNQK
eukprot:Gb_15576 [translate_table: standard]